MTASRPSAHHQLVLLHNQRPFRLHAQEQTSPPENELVHLHSYTSRNGPPLQLHMNTSHQHGFDLALPGDQHAHNGSVVDLYRSTSLPQVELPRKMSKRNRSSSPSEDDEMEVVALSPRTLLAVNRFFCEVCGKGFPRDQNLQLHMRNHAPGSRFLSSAGPGDGLSDGGGRHFDEQESDHSHYHRAHVNAQLRSTGNYQGGVSTPAKRVYICPEPSCPHHVASKGLSDLTGIKKHFSRKHGERRWRCERCFKAYAVHSDWKAHVKICGSRQYRCDHCDEVFTRKDNYNKHKDYCTALAKERERVIDFGGGDGGDGGYPGYYNGKDNGAGSREQGYGEAELVLQAASGDDPARYHAASATTAPSGCGLELTLSTARVTWRGEAADDVLALTLGPLPASSSSSCMHAAARHQHQPGNRPISPHRPHHRSAFTPVLKRRTSSTPASTDHTSGCQISPHHEPPTIPPPRLHVHSHASLALHNHRPLFASVPAAAAPKEHLTHDFVLRLGA